MKKDEGVFELKKMDVVSTAKELKLGEALLQRIIKEAPKIVYKRLFLLTSIKCEAAIHLYKKNDFVHCKDIMRRYVSAYQCVMLPYASWFSDSQ